MACSPRVRLFLFALAMSTSLAGVGAAAAAGAVFEVRRKLPRHGGDLAVQLKHDANRHLSGIDVPLGGNPTKDTGLYFTQLAIGTPADQFYMEVDTSMDGVFVNCISCRSCPRKNGLGMELNLYDPTASQSSSTILCNDTFCAATKRGVPPGCTPTSACQYSITSSGDGRSPDGIFIRDLMQYNQVSGDDQTTPASASIAFGCGSKLEVDLGSTDKTFDGIIGFGRSNSSMLSQLAASGKVRRVFAHCLDTTHGGGIFAIGSVVQPTVRTTVLVPTNRPHYHVSLKSIDVGGSTLQLPKDTYVGEGKGTIIDSGTTLTYLPEVIYKTAIIAIFDSQPKTSFYNFQDFLCFQYSGSVDDGFPTVSFQFEGELVLNVYPHDYLLHNGSNWYCVGLRNGRSQNKDRKDMVILGDLVLSNKLVVYNLEEQVVGWTDYDCSSSLKMKDEESGSVYNVQGHHISSAGCLQCQVSVLLLLVFLVLGC